MARSDLGVMAKHSYTPECLSMAISKLKIYSQKAFIFQIVNLKGRLAEVISRLRCSMKLLHLRRQASRNYVENDWSRPISLEVWAYAQYPMYQRAD